MSDDEVGMTGPGPRHMLIGVTVDGDGPVEPDEPGFDHWACWCRESRGRPARIKFNGGRGLTLCPATNLPIYHGFPPGSVQA